MVITVASFWQNRQLGYHISFISRLKWLEATGGVAPPNKGFAVLGLLLGYVALYQARLATLTAG